MDALAVTSIGTECLKLIFQRERRSQAGDPNRFFAGSHAQSFPSGELVTISVAVTRYEVWA